MEAPSALRGLLLLLLFGSLFGQLALLVQEIVAPNDYCLTSREAAEYVDVSFVWAHVGAALTAAVLAFGALSLALRAAPVLHRTERCVASAAFSAAAAVVNTAGLLAPAGEAQQRTIGWLMLVQSACAALAVGVALGARAGAPGPACLDSAHTRHAFRDFFDDAETGMPSLAKLERFLEVRSVRGSIRASFRRSNGALAAAGGALGLLALCATSLELARTAGVRPPLLSDRRIAELNDAKVTASYFGDAPTQPAGSARVVLLVVSGMRADALAVPALARLLSTPHIARDALTLTLRAGPPSTSTSQWLSLLAGASARTTGVWGGVRVPESRFDSLFRQARLYSLSSFVSGSPWLTELFHSQLLRGERFYAEGAVPQPYAALPAADAADGRTGGAETDRQRMLLLRRAMAASHAPAAGSAAPGSAAPGRRRLFELLVAQLSEAETQAQCAGATAAFNARGSYAAAIANVSASVEQLIREMDARTTLIITSDHGHIDRGGAGGAEAHATSVPLIAYAPGSNLGLRAASAQRFSAAPRFDASPLRTSDLAPTLSALLGIPAPRQSEGVPIDDLMPLANRHALGLTYRDVYVQQQRLVASLAAALGIRLGGADAALIDAPPSTVDIVAVRDGVLALRDLRQRVLDRAAASAARSASFFTFLGALAVGGLLLWITQRGSFADVRLVISPLPGQYANRRAAVFAGVATACYFAAASAVHLLLLRLRGYSAWDSTPLAFPTEASAFTLDLIIPSTLCAYVLIRAYHFPYLVTDPHLTSDDDRREGGGGGRKGGRGIAPRRHKGGAPPERGLASLAVAFVRCIFMGDAPVYSDVAMIYLCKVYLLLFSAAATLLLLCIQARSYAFAIPHLLHVPFDVEALWTDRFRLLTLAFIAAAQLLASSLMLLTWPSNALATAYYDKLYSLAILKWEARYGPSGRSDDLVGLLEEETAALMENDFRSPRGDEDD